MFGHDGIQFTQLRTQRHHGIAKRCSAPVAEERVVTARRRSSRQMRNFNEGTSSGDRRATQCPLAQWVDSITYP
jgi:hypothetical protein